VIKRFFNFKPLLIHSIFLIIPDLRSDYYQNDNTPFHFGRVFLFPDFPFLNPQYPQTLSPLASYHTTLTPSAHQAQALAYPCKIYNMKPLSLTRVSKRKLHIIIPILYVSLLLIGLIIKNF